jgi:hypothetical protein
VRANRTEIDAGLIERDRPARRAGGEGLLGREGDEAGEGDSDCGKRKREPSVEHPADVAKGHCLTFLCDTYGILRVDYRN